MDPARWRRINDVFQDAIACAADRRRAFLVEICAEDAALRDEVGRLVRAHEHATSFLARPALPDARHLLAVEDTSELALRPPETLQDEAEFRGTLRFSVLRRLGAGGMGVVYACHDGVRDEVVALKTLRWTRADGLYRLKREFRSLADIDHPNVVRLHELVVESDCCFFTMELVDGETFDRWVRPGTTLDETRLRQALQQLVTAVNAIHAADKLHRDLKPSNVLVTPAARVVVLDFGLAVNPDLDMIGDRATRSNAIGTPAYMPPEQVAGSRAMAAGDLYEIGVMLFEALTGRLPFQGSVREILTAKLQATAPLASLLAPAIPKDLDALCAKLLAREPSSRPDMTELHARLGMSAVFEVSGQALVASTPPVPLQLLGRGTELAALRSAFDASCTSGKPVILLLSGESGIGKSALCEVFLAGLRADQHAVVLSGRCFERESVPFKAFDVVVDELSRYLARMPELELQELLPRDTHALRSLFPVLGRLPAVAAAPSREAEDPHELRRHAFLAFGELLARMRDRQPVVLHLDDWQWSDTDSTLLLMHLLRQADPPRLLLVVSHRSERMPDHHHLRPLYEVLPFDTRLDVRRHILGPLPLDATHALLRAQLGYVPVAFAREAGGNPFLLSELGRYARAHASVAATEISLEHVLVDRVAVLPEAQRRIVHVLAVAGCPIDLGIAAEAADVTAGPRTLFEALRQVRLVRATGAGRLVECYHDKVREALLGSLSDTALREHHAALALALTGQADTDAERLAAHLFGAGDNERAVQQLLRAAQHAYRELAFDRAARLYTRALQDGRFEPVEAQRLQVARADALAEAGRGVESAEAYLAAGQSASAEAKHALEQRAGEQYLFSGRLEQGRILLARALARRGVHLRSSTVAAAASLMVERARLRWRGLGFEERPPGQATTDLTSFATSARALGRLDFVRGAELSARYLRLALDAGDTAHVVIALSMEIWHRTLGVGNTAEIPSLLARAEALLGGIDEFKAECWLHFCRGFYLYRGPAPNLEAAIVDFDRFLELTRERHYTNASYDRRMAEHNRNNARVQLGQLAEVARGLPALLDNASERGDYVVLPLLAGESGTLAMIAIGALDDAHHELDRASRVWSACHNAYTFQDCFLLAGSTYLALARGDVRAAWTGAQQDLVRLLNSPLRSSPPLAARVRMTSASAALAVAARCDGSARAALVREAVKLAAGLPANGMSGPFLATLAWLRGQPETALTTLRAAVAGMDDHRFPLQTHLIRRRLGQLTGGDEGRALISAADAFLRAGGAIDPAHLSATCVMPGIDLG